MNKFKPGDRVIRKKDCQNAAWWVIECRKANVKVDSVFTVLDVTSIYIHLERIENGTNPTYFELHKILSEEELFDEEGL